MMMQVLPMNSIEFSIQTLANPFGDLLGSVLRMPKNMNSLRTEMDCLKSERDLVVRRIAYAEKNQNMACRPRVRWWLLKVENIEAKFTEIADNISQNNPSCCGSFFTKFKYGQKVSECLAAVEELKKGGDFDVVAYPVEEEYNMEGNSELVTAVAEEDIPLLQRGPPYRVGNHSPTIQAFMSEMAKQSPRPFSPVELERFTSKFSFHLGSGGYGDVYKGVLPSGERIAVKVLNNKFKKKIIKEQFMAEVSTIGTTNHINLVRLYGFCFDVKKKALVYEFMENGSLDNKLFDPEHLIDWEKIPFIAIGIAKGLSYLHEDCREKSVHYDIKPGNILLDSDFCPKIADFGLAKFYDREMTHVSMSGFKGTPGYAAPEIWKRTPWPVTSKCDVYSYGIMLFELVGRRRHFDEEFGESEQWFPKHVWNKFEEGQVEELLVQCGIPDEYRKSAKKMVMAALCCIQQNPSDRPSMGEVVKILEGEVEATKPPNPFHNSVSVYLPSNSRGDGESRLPGGSIEINGDFFTPVMEQYAIEMATLPGGIIEVNGRLFTPIMNKYGIEMASSS